MEIDKPLKRHTSIPSDILQPLEEFASVTSNEDLGLLYKSKNALRGLPSEKADFPLKPPSRHTALERSLARKNSLYRCKKLTRPSSQFACVDPDRIFMVLTDDDDIDRQTFLNHVKDMDIDMWKKREVITLFNRKRRASMSTAASVCFQLMYPLGQVCTKVRRVCSVISYNMTFWRHKIKYIRGHFGSSIASYFVFLRWLFILNICNLVFPFLFLAIPQLIHDYTAVNITPVKPSIPGANNKFVFHNIFTGAGWLDNSYLYYGRYANATVELFHIITYDMREGLLCSVLFTALSNLIVISLSLARSYRINHVLTSRESMKFSRFVFSAWDYNVEMSTGATIKKRIICNQLQEMLYSDTEKSSKSTSNYLRNVAVQFLVNLVILLVVIGVGKLIFKIQNKNAIKIHLPVMDKMSLSITVTCISIIFYYAISFVIKKETFISKAMQLYQIAMSVYVLRVVMLGIIVFYWLVIEVPEKGDPRCYESLIGEEVYRLIISNFSLNVIIFTLTFGFLWNYLRRFFPDRWYSFELPEFELGYNMCDLIWYQMLAWLCVFYSPMMPIVLLVIFFLLFEIKSHSILANCKLRETSLSSTQAQTMSLLLCLISFLLVASAVIYNMVNIKPSISCGPFQRRHHLYGIVTHKHWYKLAKESIFGSILVFLYSPCVTFTVFLFMISVLVYLKVKTKGLSQTIEILNSSLVMEGLDKVLLVRALEHQRRRDVKEFLEALPS